MMEAGVKRVALYYQASPGISEAQVVGDINSVRHFCRLFNWNPVQTYIDKGNSGSMYRNMQSFARDPKNKISITICVNNDGSFAGVDGGSKEAQSESSITAEVEARDKFTGGGVPYGYIIRDGMLAIDPEKASVILEIFESKARGDSLQTIADALNGRGIKSARGGLWSKPGIAFILKNRAYIGEYRGSSEERGAGSIPKIVSPELFHRIKEPE